MTPFTYGSVCSGIEAATVAWHPLGWRAAWFAEIEKEPSAILKHHYPRTPNLGDMTKIAAMIRLGIIPAPDALVGGTPCQAFSVAGLRRGMSDSRGKLTLSFVDLANAIDEQRIGNECVIYWENVPGVLSDKENAFGCYLAALAGSDDELIPEPRPVAGKNSAHWRWSKKSGNHTLSWPNAGSVHGPRRTIAWRVFDAQYFGVAQRRRRVFLVASARAGFNPAKLLFESDGVRRDSPPRRETGQEIAGTLAACAGGGGFPGTDESLSGYVQPVAAPVTTSEARPRGDGLDNILVMAHGQGGADVSVGRSPTLTCNHEAPIAFYSQAHLDVLQTMLNGAGGPAGHNARSGHTKDSYIVPVCVIGTVTHPLRADGFDASEDGTGRGTPIVVHGTQDPCTSNHVAFALGRNSGGENVVLSVALRGREGGSTAELGDDVAGCLRASSGGGGDKAHVLAPSTLWSLMPQNSGKDFKAREVEVTQPLMAGGQTHGNQGGDIIQSGMRVRRLMPVECERLQYFPDNYTLVPFNKKMMADGPRYKVLGNSMCVSNMRWLGQRLITTHPELFIDRSVN